MKYSFGKVLENEMDIVIMNSIAKDKGFVDTIFAELDVLDLEISEIIHSLVDPELGESDIAVFGKTSGESIAILIEDKIDAIAMPNQAGRYKARAEKLVCDGIVDNAEYMLIAPSHYIETNSEASKYPYYVTYEKLMSYYIENGDMFSSSIIEQALYKEKSGYTPIRNDAVTTFWQEYYQYRRNNYPELQLPEVEGSRGTKAAWPTFKTNNKKMNIIHKSDRGVVDLELADLGGAEDSIKLLLKDVLEDDMHVVNTSKSASIRIRVPEISFAGLFEEQLEAIYVCFEAVRRLAKVSERINYAVLVNGNG